MICEIYGMELEEILELDEKQAKEFLKEECGYEDTYEFVEIANEGKSLQQEIIDILGL